LKITKNLKYLIKERKIEQRNLLVLEKKYNKLKITIKQRNSAKKR